jgi:hypothetical protein
MGPEPNARESFRFDPSSSVITIMLLKSPRFLVCAVHHRLSSSTDITLSNAGERGGRIEIARNLLLRRPF